MPHSRSFPFAAIVAQDQLKRALCLNAVDPTLGGVLIRGEKGTAKTTAARSLAALLPPLADGRAPGFVDLPLGATEDRVVGTLDIEHALRHGERRFEPGLLARAHEGVLYVDEVNLLDDHLVDVLLDVCASGSNVIEREGVSHSHPARFVLIGSMNPEEGDLRPQLTDRFAHCVDVGGIADTDERVAVIERRLAFERDPAGFAAAWHDADARLAQGITAARERLPRVGCPASMLRLAADIGVACGVHGHRADIAMVKTATAIAAWNAHDQVAAADVRAAADLVLPHRLRRQPFDQEQAVPQERIDEAVERHEQRERERHSPAQADGGSADDADDGPSAGSPPTGPPTADGEDRVHGIAAVRLPPVGEPPRRERRDRPRRGQGGARTNDERGRYVRARAVRPGERARDIAVDASLRAAALRGGRPTPADLRCRVRARRGGRTVILVVDASGSMGARRRMAYAKGAALDLLRAAYRTRDRVAFIAFRRDRAEVVLPPTRSIELAQRRLADLPTGGRTPLAQALHRAAEVVDTTRRAQGGPCEVVLISDGRATVPLAPGGDALADAEHAARVLAATGARCRCLDCEQGPVRLALISRLARWLDATVTPLAIAS